MANVMSMEAIRATADRLGFDLSSIDLDSIRLPPGENLGIISDDEDLEEGEPLEFGNVIVVDNLPVVPKEKFERLEGVVLHFYRHFGIINEGGIWMPTDADTQKTLGYCFIEYNTPQEAEVAKDKTHGHKLDRFHVLAVTNMRDGIEKLKAPEEWAPPETKPYIPGENLQKWLTDEVARDQFVIRAGSNTEVLWNDVRQLKPELVYKKTVK